MNFQPLSSRTDRPVFPCIAGVDYGEVVLRQARRYGQSIGIYSLRCHTNDSTSAMDKKDKKHLDVLRQRQQKLQLQLAGARKQADEPTEIEQLQQQLAAIQLEIDKLKAKDL